MSQDSDNLFELQVDRNASISLAEAAKWSRFISVIYFVLFGILLMTMVFGFASMRSDLERILGEGSLNPAIFLTALVPVLALIFVMAFLLNRFASFTRDAIARQDQYLLDKGIKALKNYFMIYGIIAVLSLASNLITLLISIGD